MTTWSILHLHLRDTMPSLKWSVLYSVSAFVKANGLAFDSNPNNTTIAATGSNQTFTWKLSLRQKDKSKHLQVQFGPWDRKYKIVKSFFMTVKQEPSGKNETVATADQSTARRLHWNGDLSRDYYIAFELVNIQRKDAGDYGIRFRVDHFPPDILQNWFSLIVQVRGFFFSDRQWKGFPDSLPVLKSILRLLFCRKTTWVIKDGEFVFIHNVMTLCVCRLTCQMHKYQPV